MINQSGEGGRVGRTAQQVEPRSRPLPQDDQVERDQADAGLRESERLYRTTFDRAVVGIAHTSPEGRWLRFNQRLCDLLGYSRDELAARTFQDVTHPDDLAASLACVRRLLAGERDAEELDKRYLRKDGAPVWVHVTMAIVRTPEGAPDYTIAMVQDITERKQLEHDRARLLEWERAVRHEAEAALARAQVSEARFQRLVDANIIGVAVSDGEQVLEANDAFLQLLGYTRDDLMAGRLSRLTLNAPEYLSATAHAIQEARTHGVCAPFEKEYVRLDGTRVPVWVGIVRLEGEPPRLVTFVVDLREQKRLAHEREEALRSREEWFRTMADTAPVLLWVAGPDALVTFLNAPWLQFTGRSLEQELGNGWAQGVHPDDYHRCLETYLTAFHAHQPFTMEYRLRRFDGEYRWLLDNGIPRYAPDGVFLGYIGSAIDFTDHLQLEREREAARANELALREVNQHMEAFLATAAHDLRNPLMAADGYVQLALMRLEKLQTERVEQAEQAASVPPAARAQTGAEAPAGARRSRQADPMQALGESLRAAADGIQRLSRMVTRLFDVARARAGTLELQLVPCDLAALVREQVEAQRVATPDRIIQLDMPGTPGMSDRQDGPAVPVLADADRLDQVLANYLSNALKYSAADRPVEMRLEVVDGAARVSVRDQGPGLSPEEQPRIWEPFHRAPGVAVRSGSAGMAASLGLGLHICKTIVEGHGGQVGVESAVGQGATFWFTIPVVAADAATRRLLP